MKKVIKLTESDLARIVKRVLKEQQAAAPAQSPSQAQNVTRRYQIGDFTAFKPGMVITFNDFVTKYRNSVSSVGENETIWFGYDKLEGAAKKENLCGILNSGKNVVGPQFKQGATEDVVSFYRPPVKFVCQGTSPKYGNIEVKQINQNDANIIDSGKDESEKKYTTDAPYLISQ